MVLCLRSSQLFATFHLLLATQQNIKETHPKIYDQFMVGNFSVKRTDESFNKLPPDQVIEQTINKEQKGARGIIGISTSDGAV